MVNNGEPRSHAVLVVIIVGATLSTLAVFLRVYARWILLHSFGKDDAVMVGGWVFLVATAVTIGLEFHYGMGFHVADVPAEDYVPYMKSFYSSIFVYGIAINLVKTSVILQYCRIFKNTVFYRFYFAVMLGLLLWIVVGIFLTIFICVPIDHLWDSSTPGTCLDRLVLWMTVSIVNMLTDLTCLVIPIPPLLKLQMPRNEKILLSIIFGMALCPCVISAYRITTLIPAAMSTDITYDNPRAAIWSFLELSTGTVAACLPAFRPVLVKLVPHIFTTSSQSGPTQAREQYCMEHGVSLQSSHTKTKAYTGSRADSESTQDLGFLRNDEYGAWDRDEVSIRQLS